MTNEREEAIRQLVLGAADPSILEDYVAEPEALIEDIRGVLRDSMPTAAKPIVLRQGRLSLSTESAKYIAVVIAAADLLLGSMDAYLDADKDGFVSEDAEKSFLEEVRQRCGAVALTPRVQLAVVKLAVVAAAL
ncbi:MAG: hypothetical protein H6730_01350 [Deltaproteobacteria bacterium]|nr:hypothetical protein [Deltaproteobacteria bacterium]